MIEVRRRRWTGREAVIHAGAGVEVVGGDRGGEVVGGGGVEDCRGVSRR